MLEVTLSDIQAVRPNTASNIAADRITAYNEEARNMDLQPALGSDFLYLIDTDNTSPLTYAVLVNGGTYTYDTKKYTFSGLKKALAYFVYARLVRANQLNVTAFGVVKKTDPNSEQADYKMLTNMANEAADIGTAYLQDCLLYITRTYPTQEQGELTTQKKFNITPLGD